MEWCTPYLVLLPPISMEPSQTVKTFSTESFLHYTHCGDARFTALRVILRTEVIARAGDDASATN